MQECLTTQNTIQRKGDCKIMSDKIIENNQVTIMGEIASPFFFSHEVYGEGFYMVDVQVKRLSNSEDRIPLMVSERLRCFAPPNRYLQVKSLISSAIADFFCVKIYVFYCCIILRFT